LGLYISSGRVNEYYEVVFKEMIADGSLFMDGVVFDPERWYEIDTPADIVHAQRMLGETDIPFGVC
jgi:NDP-sugar pyrophosphorylase family protein